MPEQNVFTESKQELTEEKFKEYRSRILVNKKDVEKYIPHRAPFIMVDELYYYDNEYACSGFLVEENNVLLINNELDESGIVENMAQTMALKAAFKPAEKAEGQAVEPRMGYLVAVNRFKLYAKVAVGQKIYTTLKVKQDLKTFLITEGICTCNDVLVARGELTVYVSQ